MSGGLFEVLRPYQEKVNEQAAEIRLLKMQIDRQALAEAELGEWLKRNPRQQLILFWDTRASQFDASIRILQHGGGRGDTPGEAIASALKAVSR
jgi:hypothetical protein